MEKYANYKNIFVMYPNKNNIFEKNVFGKLESSDYAFDGPYIGTDTCTIYKIR